MLGVVLSKQNNGCIVLAEDESMRTIPAAKAGSAELQVGDVIDLDRYLGLRRHIDLRILRVLAIVVVVVIAIIGIFWYTTFDVSATVTTRGEAPVTLYLNHWGHVLRT